MSTILVQSYSESEFSHSFSLAIGYPLSISNFRFLLLLICPIPSLVFHSVILVSAGLGPSALTSVEVLSKDGTPLANCTIPPLPAPREDPTQQGSLACGGWRSGAHRDTLTSCLNLTGRAANEPSRRFDNHREG